MTKNINYVSHKKSSKKVNGKPQLPSPGDLVLGEIAINFAKDVETLSIKNESGTVVTFSSDNYYTEQKLGSGFTGANSARTVTEVIEHDEEVTAAALNNLNDIKLDVTSYTPVDLTNYYTKDETSGKTEISNALGSKVNSATFTAHTADTNAHLSGSEKENLDALATNIAAISGITSQDIDNWNSGAGVDLSNYYKKFETSGATELSTEFSNKASQSDLNALSGTVTGHTANTTIHVTSADKTAWNAKTDSSAFTAHTASTVHMNASEKENLDSLATNIATISGITSEKASNWDTAYFNNHTHTNKSYLDGITGSVGTMAYQNTSSYSSATEVNTALGNKANTSDIPSVTPYADSVKYNPTSKEVEFYHGTTAGTMVFSYDASPFLIDGMVQDVKVTGVTSGDVTVTCLVISFNTDAGKQNINIPISQIFDASNYYTKSETSGKTELSTAFSNKLDKSDFNTYSGGVDTAISNKASQSDLNTLSGTVTSHTSNNTIHVTSDDKTKWNKVDNKQDSSGMTAYTLTSTTNTLSGTVTAHTADTSIHFTTGDVQTQIDNSISGKVDTSTFNTHTGSSVHMTTTEKTNLDSLATNIATISGITSTKVGNWDTAYTNNHTHSNKSALDSITGNVGTMAYENKNSYSSATEVNTALAGKAATATTLAGYGITDAYTKAQTSGASEISSALSYKASQSDLNAISATVTSHTASINDLSGQSETIAAAINDLDDKKADSVEVFSSIATKANKSDIDDLIKQSETISAALNYLNDEKLDYLDFFDYTSQMKSALESIEDEIEDLSRTVVMDITTTDARGYGESTPTLAQYTGNKSNLNGILSHFKLGWFNSGGTLVQECAPGRISAARDGSEIAINGSNGDLMVYVDTDIYRDRATVSGLTVNGSTATTHNVIGLGLAPHQIGGSVAKKFSPFGFTPHCAKYSNSKGYSYYDGGNVQTSINSLTSSVNALNKGGGYMGLYYEFYEIWLIAMYLELGTLDFTQDTLFGYGCTNYTPTASNWFSDVNAGGGGCMYSGNTYGSFWTNTVSSYNFAEMLEAQRIMDGVVKADLVDSMGGTVMMTYDSNGNVVLAPEADPSSWANSTGMTEGKKYFTVKNVPGCQGLGDGVMTGVVNIYVKGTDRIRKYSHPIYRGVDLLSGFFVQLEGLHYVVKHTGTTASLAQSQELFYCESWLDVPTDTSVYTNANSIVTADTAEGLTDDPVLVATYKNAGAFPTGSDGWGKETDYNISLFAHRITGGAQHTYECGHIWYRGTSWSSPAGTDSNGWLTKNAKSANASVVGCAAHAALAGRTLDAYSSVAHSNDNYAGGFAHPQIKVK